MATPDAIPSREVPPPSSPGRHLGWCFVMLGLAVVHFVAARWAWVDIPLQTDTGIWAYFAGRMLDGACLYRDLWESKPPGIFLAFAAIEWGFGVGGDRALFWLDAVVTAAVCLVTYFVARRFSTRGAATAAVWLLSVVMCHRVLADWGDNLEKFVAFFEMAALWMALSRISVQRWLWIGLCCGLAAVFKQTGVLLFVLLAVGLISGWRELGVTDRRGQALGLLVLGTVVPWLMVFAWLAAKGSVSDFWRQVVVHDLSRATTEQSERMEPLTWSHWTHVGRHLALALVVLGPALAACVAYWTRGKVASRQDNARSGLGLVAVYGAWATLVFVLAPNSYGHYLLQAAPPAAVLTAWLFSTGMTPRDRPLTALIFFGGLALGIWHLGDHVTFIFRPNCEARRAYSRIRERTDALTAVLRDRVGPGQSVMLWPADHAVSYYAGRQTPLEICQAIDIFNGRIGVLNPSFSEVFKRLEARPPDVIVDWTPVRMETSNREGAEPELLVPAGGFSLAEEPNDAHPHLEGRLLAPLKTWVRANYGGQERIGDLCTVYYRGRPWRDWQEYLAPSAKMGTAHPTNKS